MNWETNILPLLFTSLALKIFLLALLFEVIDAALGQGYGTLGAPTFILMGFDPKAVVPAILISQAIGGLVSAVCHHKFNNVDFGHWRTNDLKRVLFIALFGIVGVTISSILGIKLPKSIMSVYIGLMVVVIGAMVVSGIRFNFSWKKLALIGTISAFNKGLSGGGYGPLVAGGQVVIGVDGKAAVGITDFAEAPICLTGFAIWTFMGGTPPLDLTLPMCIGAGIAPLFGAWLTYRIPTKHLRFVLGGVLLLLGVLCLLKVINP
ncbi:sulfite exporter TauE/SafE family protein [bacterium]|nr:sulfite exporter TauE/SafE family protein [bacterium]